MNLLKKNDDDSWNRFPEAKIRMREDGLKSILEGLGEDGFCIGSEPRVQLLDDGVYIDILLNVGEHGNIVALPFEVFIPAKIPAPKKKKEKQKDETVPTVPATPVADELLAEPEAPAEANPTSSDAGVQESPGLVC
jgi:hypothetical protein